MPRRRPWASDPGLFLPRAVPRRRLRLARSFYSHRPQSARPARSPRDGFGWFTRIVVLILALAALAGCSPGGDSSGTTAPPAGSGDLMSLAGVCPARVVIQAGWLPTADIAVPFHLLGADRRIDAGRKRVSGSLVAGGKDTGVDIEFRSGGPATGFQTGPAVAYTDRSVTLAFTNLDEIIGLSATQPMTAVMAPLNGDPQVLIWDPATHPDFGIVQDVGQTDTPVVYSANASTVFGYLTGSGILRASQLDASYDGSPSRFVASRGRVVVQGYATNEPHIYESLPAWGRPVRYGLIQDTGYPNYANVLAVRTGDRNQLTDCLTRLVPILQRALVEFMADPRPALGRIVEAVAAFRAGFVYDQKAAEFGVCQLRALGLVSNTISGVAGGFDSTKLKRMVDIVRPVLTAQRKPVPAELDAADIATADYLDPAIALPTSARLSGVTCPRSTS